VLKAQAREVLDEPIRASTMVRVARRARGSGRFTRIGCWATSSRYNRRPVQGFTNRHRV